MDFPYLLIVLLTLPLAVAAVIVAVSTARRKSRAAAHGRVAEPVHRGQADTAAVQNAASRPEAAPRKVTAGRVRRAGTAARPTDA